MKNLLLIFAGLSIATFAARAQVSVEVVLDDEYFLPGEAIVANVRISNLSGQVLKLGNASDWLEFNVESKDGLTVPVTGVPAVTGEFLLESATTATKRVDLSPNFDLTVAGRYTIAATVRIAQWQSELTTKPKLFIVTSGKSLWQQEFGVPNPPGVTTPPEVRRYALQQATHTKVKKLYVRITDLAENRVFRVFAVGPMMNLTRPEPQVDRQSNLHLLFQTGARAFTYCVINPDGQLIGRQTHDYTSSRPTLKVDAEGNITVNGGARRLAATDLPEPAKTSPATNVPSPKS
ncbi:MAG: hypothetical protein HY043_23245 [Verrucomicrobia bacterium]|nr:hypothetical protein [Verrucomicrobiota bacterium]